MNGVRDIDATQLVKELREQGFKLERTSDGWLVENPTTGQLYSYHESQVGNGANRSWANTQKELERIGYNPDRAAAKREQKTAAREERKRMPGHFICTDPVCGCGREFPYAQNLGRHLAAVRDRKDKERLDEEMPVQRAESLKPAPPEEIKRARQLIKLLRSIGPAAVEMADILEKTLQENVDLKRKASKIEELLGKTIDNL